MNSTTLDELKAVLGNAFDDSPSRELAFKSMFGGACAYVNGRVFASLSNVGLALKIDNSTANLWLERGGKWLQYEPEMPISKSYILVPEAVASDGEELARWVELSAQHVLSLPAPKSRKKRA